MIIGGILFGVAACTAPADGYRITGNIEGAGDGKAILLQSAGFGEPTMGDSVNMRNGKFVFEGRLESPVSVTVKVCPDSDQPASLGFIAENSPIRVMAAWKDVIERYGYRSIGGQTVEGSLNQEVYEKIAGVYGQILKAPEHKEYAEAQQKMAGLRNTDTEAYYKLQDETEPLSERFSEAVRQRQLELIRENRTVESSVLNLRMMWNDMTLEELKEVFSVLDPKVQNSPMAAEVRSTLCFVLTLMFLKSGILPTFILAAILSNKGTSNLLGRHPLYSQHIEAQFIFCNVADIREICNYLASVHY